MDWQTKTPVTPLWGQVPENKLVLTRDLGYPPSKVRQTV
jgi:hypothetical protein